MGFGELPISRPMTWRFFCRARELYLRPTRFNQRGDA
jgi:hypothetical protein